MGRSFCWCINKKSRDSGGAYFTSSLFILSVRFQLWSRTPQMKFCLLLLYYDCWIGSNGQFSNIQKSTIHVSMYVWESCVMGQLFAPRLPSIWSYMVIKFQLLWRHRKKLRWCVEQIIILSNMVEWCVLKWWLLKCNSFTFNYVYLINHVYKLQLVPRNCVDRLKSELINVS